MRHLTLPLLALFLAPAAAPAQEPDEVEAQVLKKANAYRAKKDAGKLTLDDKLNATARAHARGMAKADRYGDEDNNGHVWQGKKAADRAKGAGYKFAALAENVGWNRNKNDPADAIVKAWIDSAGHEKNLVNKELTQTGIGAAKSKTGKWYFVQLFGRPATAAVSITVTIANRTKETIKFRVGNNKHEMPAGSSAKLNHTQSSGPVQIVITWPGSDKEIAELTDKGNYAFTQKDDKYVFKKADGK